MVRRLSAILLLGTALVLVGCHRNRVKNPIADVNSKQPDKVLYDRAMDAMKRGKYDVARITLQTLINTYPDSEYVARAKLSVGDSWYAEGSPTALAQAELEYKDFITFFPNMAEAAEAQLKVANIHYRQMEKPDRDYTHARRAEEEYRSLIQQFPDSKLVPEAKQRLREVQEVLAEREYRIGHFYLLKESWAAAIARLKSVTDAYPLYSKADDALMMLGEAYERQIELVRKSPMPTDERAKNAREVILKRYTDAATEAYDKVVTRYAAGGRVAQAKERLHALERPVPQPTADEVAQSKAEEESRGETGRVGRVMANFQRRPDIAATAKVGDPPLTTPPQTNATDIVAETTRAAVAAMTGQTTGEANQQAGAAAGDGAAGNSAAPATAGSGTGAGSQSVGVEVVPNARAGTPASPNAQQASPALVTPPAQNAGAQPAPGATSPQQPGTAPITVAPAPETGIEDLTAQPAAKPPDATTPAAQPPPPPPPATPSSGNARISTGTSEGQSAPAQVNDATKDSSAGTPQKGDSTSNKGKKKKKNNDKPPQKPQ